METSEHALNSSCGPQPTDSVPFEHRPKKYDKKIMLKKWRKKIVFKMITSLIVYSIDIIT